jgi:DNA-binding transcriptional regulator YdaS (Cro superfamily)
MSECNPLEHAIQILGSQERLAETLNVTTQAVYKWRRGRVPAERVLGIESATGGVVTRHQLRPDIYPSETAA